VKKSLLSLVIAAAAFSVNAQTASNFTANDCLGNNHDLYSELNSGKIIVLSWVMPCNTCITGAKFAQNAVNSFSTSNPGTVFHYVADDYANTSCASLLSWLNTNSLTPNAYFSDASVNMTAYGSTGMPKIVVLGGASHSIYYNVNGSSNTQAGITTAINNAIAANSIGINEISTDAASDKVSPNPANNELTLSMHSKQAGNIDLEIYNVTGQKIKTLQKTVLSGNNEIKLDVSDLSSGSYFLELNSGSNSGSFKFIITRE
jgi:hypothetical protein